VAQRLWESCTGVMIVGRGWLWLIKERWYLGTLAQGMGVFTDVDLRKVNALTPPCCKSQTELMW
jgi:hypothetical protein